MLLIPLKKNKKGRVSVIFLIVLVLSLAFGFYIKDWVTAFILFFGYAIIKIVINLIKGRRDENNYY
jgi:hypothetical protein